MERTFYVTMFQAQACLAVYRSPKGRALDLGDAHRHVRRALGLANVMRDKARIALALRMLGWLKGAANA